MPCDSSNISRTGNASGSGPPATTPHAGATDDDYTNFAVGGAVAFAVSENIGAQIDASLTFVDEDISDDEVFAGTAHLFHRTAEGLIGGFLGFTFGGGVTGLWWGFVLGLSAVGAALLARFLRVSAREIVPLADRSAGRIPAEGG